MRTIPLFSVLGVQTAITPLGLAAFGLAALLTGGAAAWAGLAPAPALLAGALSALGMGVSEWLHQMGHALAARRVGYPMRALVFRTILAVSVYPDDEPDLPAALHIQRALGGFWVNLAAGLLLLAGQPMAAAGGAAAWVLGWLGFWNTVVLGLGALVPIDIPGQLTTDGATLLRYWPRRREA